MQKFSWNTHLVACACSDCKRRVRQQHRVTASPPRMRTPQATPGNRPAAGPDPEKARAFESTATRILLAIFVSSALGLYVGLARACTAG